MTLEERAEEYIEKNSKMWEEGALTVDEIVRLTYRDSAKENGIQWHDLRKDPNDLPVLETELLYQKYSGRCFVGYYNHPDRKFFSHETRESYDIVRWADIGQFWSELLEGNETTFHCEIPPFDKE